MRKFALLALPIAMFSCKSDPDPIDNSEKGYDEKILIMNEGQFQVGDADLTAYDPETGSVEQAVFFNKNSVPLGDILQSGITYDGKTYLVLNNSGKLMQVDAETFEYQDQLDGLNLPRHMIIHNNQGYLVTWESFTGPGKLLKIDLSDLSILDSVQLGVLPEAPVVIENEIWIPNSGDSTVTVVDLNMNDTTLYFGAHAPNSIQAFGNQVLVLHQGRLSFFGTPTDAAMVRVDAAFKMARNTVSWVHNDATVGKLVKVNETQAAYVYNGINLWNVSNDQTGASGFSSENIYGLGYDQSKFYLGISPAFDQAGYVLIADENLNRMDSIPAGVGPNGFIFP